MSAAFLSRYAVDVILPAATPVTVDVPVNGARDWLFILQNDGDTNDVTAMTVARYPLGTAEIGEDPVSATTGLPLAAGDALPIEGTSEPITTLRVVLTSTLGTTVRIAGGGW